MILATRTTQRKGSVIAIGCSLFHGCYLAVVIEAIESIDGHAHCDFLFTHILSFPSAEDLEREDATFFNVPGYRFTIEDEGLRVGFDPL